MSVLSWGSILFITLFVLHLVIWRIKLPSNPIKTLVFLFNGIAASGALYLMGYKSYAFAQYLHILLFFFSLFVSYLITYSAIEADSPSSAIVLRIAQAGKPGLQLDAIKASLGDDLLVKERLKDLVGACLADFDGQVYKINKKGRIFILPFVIFRNILGKGRGG